MPVKCGSLISEVREKKGKKKLESVYPFVTRMGKPIPNPYATNLPPCTGTLTFEVKAETHGNCCCNTYPSLEVNVTCTKCTSPYWSGTFMSGVELEVHVQELLVFALEQKQLEVEAAERRAKIQDDFLGT